MMEYNLGIFALLSYNLLTAAKGVFLGSFLQKVPPFLVLSLCFSLVSLVFFLLNLVQKKTDKINVFSVYKHYWQTILDLNLSAVFSWGGYFFALKLIEPAIVVSITHGAGPVITALYYLCIRREYRTTFAEWCTHSITCLILGSLIFISYFGLSAVGNMSGKTVFFGAFAAIISAIAGVVNTLLIKRLNNAGLKPRQIIQVRFFLLILMGIFFISDTMWHSLGQNEIILSIIVIACFGVAMPLFLVQVGTQKTNPITVALTMASLPIFMLACQVFDHRLTASIYSVVGAFSVAIIYMISLVLKSSSQITFRRTNLKASFSK